MLRMVMAGLLVSLGALAPAAAQDEARDFPNRAIRIVVPFPAGGPADVASRLLGQKMSEDWGQPVVIENRVGANTVIGAQQVGKAAPDGYTLLMAIDSTLTMNQYLYRTPPYDPFNDFVPITLTAKSLVFMYVNAASDYRSMKEIIAAAKAQPGKLNYATAGTGSATHMALERFRFAAGFEVLNVHTKGAGEALTEVVAGRADCYFALVFQAQKMKDSGKVDAHLVSGPKRSALMPSLPTTEEAGYRGSAYNFWLGTLVAAKTPRPIVERLAKEINALVQSPEISGRIVKLGADPLTLSISEFQAMIDRELKENAELIRKAGIKAN
ncbi:MAG: Bug family tripartite tricarboxylate transporter substrate binding protein [Burkholderiales bacterium]